VKKAVNARAKVKAIFMLPINSHNQNKNVNGILITSYYSV